MTKLTNSICDKTQIMTQVKTVVMVTVVTVVIRAAFEDFLTQNSAKIRSNLRNSEQIRSKKSGDNYVLEAPRTGKIAWSSCLQSPARLGCSILLRFHYKPPDSRAYWYKSATKQLRFQKSSQGGVFIHKPNWQTQNFLRIF